MANSGHLNSFLKCDLLLSHANSAAYQMSSAYTAGGAAILDGAFLAAAQHGGDLESDVRVFNKAESEPCRAPCRIARAARTPRRRAGDAVRPATVRRRTADVTLSGAGSTHAEEPAAGVSAELCVAPCLPPAAPSTARRSELGVENSAPWPGGNPTVDPATLNGIRGGSGEALTCP